jgi:hypothetical protein
LFGSFDKEKMTDALRQSKMFKGQLDVLPGQELLQYIPVGVSEAENGVLPDGSRSTRSLAKTASQPSFISSKMPL